MHNWAVGNIPKIEEKYALKGENSASVDLKDYRKKDDHSVIYTKAINYKTQYQSGRDRVKFDKELMENTHLIGYLIDNDVRKDFDIVVKKGEVDKWGGYYCIISADYLLSVSDDGLTIACSNDKKNNYNTYITDATIEMNDEYSLKTDIYELKEVVESSSVFIKNGNTVGFAEGVDNIRLDTSTGTTPFQIYRNTTGDEYSKVILQLSDNNNRNGKFSIFSVNFEDDAVKIITNYLYHSSETTNTISFKNTGGIVIDNLQNSDGVKYALESTSNMTITHYAPIDDGDISDFVIGKPVFMSGYVYKQEGNGYVLLNQVVHGRSMLE